MNTVSNILISLALINLIFSLLYILLFVNKADLSIHICSQAITFASIFILLAVLIDKFNFLVLIIGIIIIVAMPLSSYILMKK